MFTRDYHYLRKNDVNETMHNAIFVDCETDDFLRPDGITEKRLRFGWACYIKRNGRGEWCKPIWKRFREHEEFWLWVVSLCHKRRRTWMWCHNSNFDYPALHVFSYPQTIGWRCVGMCVEAPPTIIRFKMGSRTLVCCDTLNIWRMSLQKMGKKIGLEKLPMPKGWTDDASEDAYCQRDVQIMVEMMKNWCDFLRREDMGAFRPTIAGQAMQTYRHKYMDYPILIDANEEALKVARNAYKGGRVEAGYIGHLTQAVHHLDINSMYPSVMAAHDFPTKLVQYTPFVSVRGLARLLQTHCVCAFVSLNTDEPFAPILFKHKLAFPVGKFDAYLSSPELEYALERGFISNIHVAAIYERAPIFKRFVRDLYQKKEQASLRGDTVERDHWKLVLNSFYGKWGQNGRHYWLYTDEPRPEFPTKFYVNFQSGKKTCFRYFGDYILASTNEAESRHSHPAIAAHVTAHARMVLYALIRELAPEHYFYSDTDAVFTSDTGLKRLRHRIDDTRLGLLKHVASYQDVWIYGAKDYVLDGERTLKGIRDDAEQLNETTFKQIRWFRLAGLARARSLDMPLTTVITKSLRRTYSKGVVLPSGFVRPLHAPEETS